MRVHSLMRAGAFAILATILSSLPAVSQRITFSPPVDSLVFWGTCIPPGVLAELRENPAGPDSIVIRDMFSSWLYRDIPPNPLRSYPFCSFIVHDSTSTTSYELWLRHDDTSSGLPPRLVFGRGYYLCQGGFRLVLRVFEGSLLVDSASARFRAIQTGLIVDEDHGVPRATTLRQNYPNPFNPTTTISYLLGAKAHVRIRILDILGREVTTLVDREEDAGAGSVTWNGGNHPSGVYFCRMTAGVLSDTRKIILRK